MQLLKLAALRPGSSLFLATGARQDPTRWWLQVVLTDVNGPWTSIYEWQNRRNWQRLPGYYQLAGSSVACVDGELAQPVTLYYDGEIAIGSSPCVRHRHHPDQPLANEHERLEREMYMSQRIVRAMYITGSEARFHT